MIRRRHVPTVVLLALGVSAVLLTGCGDDSEEAAADGLTKVTFVTGSTGTGVNTNIIASDARGYFRDEGVDVDIQMLEHSSDTLKLLGSGKVQLGTLNSQSSIVGRSQGVPVVSLATTVQRAAHAIMAPAEAGLTEPRDLEGLTVGITGLPGNTAVLKDILRRYDVDMDKVELVDVGFDAPAALAKGTVDALGDALLWRTPMEFNTLRGNAPDDTSTYTVLPFSDLKAHRYYMLNVVTSEDYLKGNEDVIGKFMRGWRKGLEWSIAHPEEAAQLAVKANPELDVTTVTEQWKNIAKDVTGPDSERHSVGWQNPEVYQAEAEFLYENGIIDKRVDTSTMVRNEYLSDAGGTK